MHRLIYKSRCTHGINWETVRDILHNSEQFNRDHDVNGVLLATESHFLQVLEGQFEDINEVFVRIVRDPRHTDIRLISFNAIDSKLFSGWGMRGIGTFDLNKDLEDQLKKKYGEEAGGVKFPLEEWKVLAMLQDINMVKELSS